MFVKKWHLSVLFKLRIFEKEVRQIMSVFSTALSFITPLITEISWTNFLRDCLTSPACGAKYPGYLKETHPDDLNPEESVQATVCFSDGKTCCAKTQQIEIMKCKYFFIYKLPRAPVRGARYCGTGGKDNDKCFLGSGKICFSILRGCAHYIKTAKLNNFVRMSTS